MTIMDPAATAPLGSTDVRISRLGFGTMTIGGFKAAMTELEADAVLEAAWAQGLRFFDTAPQYGCGLAEERLGRFAARKSRADIVIATKVGKRLADIGSGGERQSLFPGGHDREVHFDYSYDGTLRIVEDSLTRLRTTVLDLVLIHDVTRHFHGDDGVHTRFREAMDGAVRALRRLRDEKVIRAFGTGLKDVDIALAFTEHAHMDCALLPGRMTLLEQSALTSGLLDRCRGLGVSVIAAAAFDSGILATGAVPGATYSYREADTATLARVERMQAICAKYSAPLQAAALQFPLRHRAVTGVLVSMRTPQEVERNAAWMQTPIAEDLWAELAQETGITLPA
jgi:D-threo-aldose 1-dehydrogenase